LRQNAGGEGASSRRKTNVVRRTAHALKTRIGNERDYCGHWQVWQVVEGRMPTSAGTGQRGADDGALVKKEAFRYKRQDVNRKKGPSQANLSEKHPLQ
jgi:hypothetical protein